MKEKSIYFAVEKIYCILGAIYIIFMLEFSGFKSLESLVSLVRLHRKVSKSRETFKVRDFVNTIRDQKTVALVSLAPLQISEFQVPRICQKMGHM